MEESDVPDLGKHLKQPDDCDVKDLQVSRKLLTVFHYIITSFCMVCVSHDTQLLML